jgi:cell division protein FtsZ
MKEKEKEKDKGIIQSMYGESPDIEMPDIIVPPMMSNKSSNFIEDEVDTAFKFTFVGVGQGGSRIAETFYKIGYRRVAVLNTAQQDLNTIDLENKLCFGEGGCGKKPEKAAGLFKNNREDITDFLQRSLGDGYDRIFVCAGAGGGTGAGSVCPMAHLSHEIQASLGSHKKVGIILALPKASEGKRVNANAFNTLNSVYSLVEKQIVGPLIIIDNEKIANLYPDLPVSKFWETANQSVAGLFHLFNHTATKDSTYSAFDANDYRGVLDSGLIIFGASPVEDWEDKIAVSRAVRDNLSNNLLSGGMDLRSGHVAAVVVIGGTEQLNVIPQSSLDQAFDQVSRMLKRGNTVHRGIYSGDKPGLTVFTAVGGLARPHDKLQELSRLGDIN